MTLSRSSSQPSRSRFNFGLVAVVLLALALRLYHLGTSSLWMDEGYSLAAAHHLNPFDAQRPLYFWLLRGWMHLGHSEAWLRLPSAMFGVAAVALLYLFAVQLASRSVALLAATFYALSASQIFHAQEVRMYSLAPMLLLAALYALLLWTRTRRVSLLVIYTILAYLALLTLPLVAAGLGMAVVGVAYRLRQEPRDAARLLTVNGILLVAWLPFLVRSLGHPQGLDWIEKPHLSDLLGLHSWAFIGRRLELTTAPASHGQMAQVAVIAAVALLVLGLVALAVQEGRGLTTGRAAAVWFYAVVVAVFVASLVLKPLWVERYFTSFLPALFFLTALGVRRLWNGGRGRVLAAAGTALLLLTQTFFTVRTFAVARQGREDWRGAGQFVSDHARSGDMIVIAGPADRDIGVLWHYYCPRPDIGLAPSGVPLLKAGDSAAKRDAVEAQTAALMRPLLTQGEGVWLVAREGMYNGNDAPAQVAALLPRLGQASITARAAPVQFHLYRIAINK